jgi:DNA-binding CsgD family transcriptional regulator
MPSSPSPSPSPASDTAARSPAPAEPLTARELEVLGVLSTGATSLEIAARLGIGLATVKTHLHHAYRKIGVTNRVAATRYYLGMLSDATATSAHAVLDAANPDAPVAPLGARDIEERINELEGVAAAAARLRRRLEVLRAAPPH